MNKHLLIIVLAVICIVLVSPAMARDNPYKNAYKATPADVAVNIESDTVKLSETSGVVFDGAGYTHTIGRVSIRMKPLLKGLEGNPVIKGNKRVSGTGHSVQYELYRDLIKEQVVLNTPETVRYSYDIGLSDWVTKEPDLSRPQVTMDANKTEIVSYPSTKQVTNYARDSTSDIALDQWGNIIISVNAADVVVIPRPFATDATGKRFELDFTLDKAGRTITITGDLTGAQYPITIDPTERVTNGGFETGSRDGWVGLIGDTSGYRVVSGDAVYKPFEGTYYLDVIGSGGYSVLRHNLVNYDGATSVSCAAAIPVHNTWDIPVSNMWRTYGDWLINNQGQTPQGWTVRTATIPAIRSGPDTIDIWTYSNTHGHIDSIRVMPDVVEPPVAKFTADPTTGYRPLTVKFTDTSTGSPTSWSWNFGDGGTSAEQNPTHMYTTAGTYTVRLTATNAAGSNMVEKANLIRIEAPTFSMTDELDWSASETNHANMYSKLVNENNWIEKFYVTGKSVTKSHFAVNPQFGDNTLNSATLHLHTGHGWSNREGTDSYLELLDQENKPTIKLTPSEVEGKWGGNNKWVILSSCLVLRDDRWGKALGTSHGILGFKTVALQHPEFTQEFFKYAIDEEKTVYDSFRYTTYKVMKNDWVEINPGDKNGDKEMTVAAVIFGSQEQADNDYLPGIKTGIYSDSHDTLAYRQWLCNEPPEG